MSIHAADTVPTVARVMAESFSEDPLVRPTCEGVASVLNLDWHKDLLEDEHFRLKVIAVERSLRGSGAVRRLIAPVLQLCRDRHLPVALETHNPRNVGLYEHFGFSLVRTLESSVIDVKQYCMVRDPSVPLTG